MVQITISNYDVNPSHIVVFFNKLLKHKGINQFLKEIKQDLFYQKDNL